MFVLLKKLFLPKVTDRKVDTIFVKAKSELENTSRTARRHEELLKKNGFMMGIYIASGGDNRGR